MELTANTRIITDLAQLVGMTLDGRYALRAVLGEGAMGVVFRATQLSIQRDVAIKVLKLGTFRDDASLDRFRREMEIIATLTHPNVVRLLDSGVDDTLRVFYLAMEFIEGVSLGDMLYDAPRRVTPELALEIVYQVCAGLTEPHRAGIVHRDIKPDNVLLQLASDDTVRLKVVDFGIAKAAADDERVTATGVIVGTPAYMAPELCRAAGDLDARTDLYALGIMLYELLTGFVPFQADTSLAVMLKQVSEPPPPLATYLDTEITAQSQLQGLLDILLDKRPNRRPESAREVRRMIDAIRDEVGMARVRVDSTRSWSQALADYLVRTARLPTRKEYVIRTTMVMARHTTEQLEPVVTAMAQRTRAERRATSPHASSMFALTPDRNLPTVPPKPEEVSRQRTKLHHAHKIRAQNRTLMAWLVGISACIAVLGIVAYQIYYREVISLSPPEASDTIGTTSIDKTPKEVVDTPRDTPTVVSTPDPSEGTSDPGSDEVEGTRRDTMSSKKSKRSKSRKKTSGGSRRASSTKAGSNTSSKAKKGSPANTSVGRVLPEKKDPPVKDRPKEEKVEPKDTKPEVKEKPPEKNDSKESADEWL